MLFAKIPFTFKEYGRILMFDREVGKITREGEIICPGLPLEVVRDALADALGFSRVIKEHLVLMTYDRNAFHGAVRVVVWPSGTLSIGESVICRIGRDGWIAEKSEEYSALMEGDIRRMLGETVSLWRRLMQMGLPYKQLGMPFGVVKFVEM